MHAVPRLDSTSSTASGPVLPGLPPSSPRQPLPDAPELADDADDAAHASLTLPLPALPGLANDDVPASTRPHDDDEALYDDDTAHDDPPPPFMELTLPRSSRIVYPDELPPLDAAPAEPEPPQDTQATPQQPPTSSTSVSSSPPAAAAARPQRPRLQRKAAQPLEAVVEARASATVGAARRGPEPEARPAATVDSSALRGAQQAPPAVARPELMATVPPPAPDELDDAAGEPPTAECVRFVRLLLALTERTLRRPVAMFPESPDSPPDVDFAPAPEPAQAQPAVRSQQYDVVPAFGVGAPLQLPGLPASLDLPPPPRYDPALDAAPPLDIPPPTYDPTLDPASLDSSFSAPPPAPDEHDDDDDDASGSAPPAPDESHVGSAAVHNDSAKADDDDDEPPPPPSNDTSLNNSSALSDAPERRSSVIKPFSNLDAALADLDLSDDDDDDLMVIAL